MKTLIYGTVLVGMVALLAAALRFEAPPRSHAWESTRDGEAAFYTTLDWLPDGSGLIVGHGRKEWLFRISDGTFTELSSDDYMPLVSPKSEAVLLRSDGRARVVTLADLQGFDFEIPIFLPQAPDTPKNLLFWLSENEIFLIQRVQYYYTDASEETCRIFELAGRQWRAAPSDCPSSQEDMGTLGPILVGPYGHYIVHSNAEGGAQTRITRYDATGGGAPTEFPVLLLNFGNYNGAWQLVFAADPDRVYVHTDCDWETWRNFVEDAGRGPCGHDWRLYEWSWDRKTMTFARGALPDQALFSPRADALAWVEPHKLCVVPHGGDVRTVVDLGGKRCHPLPTKSVAHRALINPLNESQP